jgi:hypothetical protein
MTYARAERGTASLQHGGAARSVRSSLFPRQAPSAMMSQPASSCEPGSPCCWWEAGHVPERLGPRRSRTDAQLREIPGTSADLIPTIGTLWNRLWFATWRLGRQLLPVTVRRRLKNAVSRCWVLPRSFERECLRKWECPGQSLTPLQQMYVDFRPVDQPPGRLGRPDHLALQGQCREGSLSRCGVRVRWLPGCAGAARCAGRRRQRHRGASRSCVDSFRRGWRDQARQAGDPAPNSSARPPSDAWYGSLVSRGPHSSRLDCASCQLPA